MTGIPRAVIFDLDDTLYRERRFALSGFRSVARTLARERQCDEGRAFAVLAQALRRGKRQTALQALCSALAFAPEIVPSLVELIRIHEPALRLPRSSARVLQSLRGECRVGILTNGMPAVQRRKVRALGVAPLVDAVVYASEHGTGLGKPDSVPFLVVAQQLGVAPEHCVFVGDDEERDMVGARAVGMRTIRVMHGTGRSVAAASCADARVTRLEDVISAAPELLRETNATCA